MIVSWNWLHDLLPLDIPREKVVERLMMAGLNHEATTSVGDDWALNLEVTSNRPDWLGHLGVAREIGVLFDLPLRVPPAVLKESAARVEQLARVRIECPESCFRYSARVIQGIRVGPSPKWLADRLQTLGIAVINNVVDATNYVMMECGQPLHAFDLAKLNGREIIVRSARPGENLQAIDHKTYALDSTMCVIADARVAVALGGVMGGAESEVSEKTQNVLLEAAEFAPLSIRTTARKLGLHSPSSYRFERGIDPEGLDWASRRCCELIVQMAGGEVASGAVWAGAKNTPPPAIVLRFSQLPRILGIEVPHDAVRRILTALGHREIRSTAAHVEVIPPSWRRDLSREIDLIEEVARVHGYDKIPEDVAVPMCPSHRRDEDRVLGKVRSVLNAAGFDEAMTASVVPAAWCTEFSPWTNAAPLFSQTPMLKGADHLRMGLVPSLLDTRRINESVGNRTIELFETAHIYLPRDSGLPLEQATLSIASNRDFHAMKGVIETLLVALHIPDKLAVTPASVPMLDSSDSCTLHLGGKLFGYLGAVAPAGLKQFGVREATVVAELKLESFHELAQLTPKYVEISPYPAIARDVNLVVDEMVRWSDLSATIEAAGGEYLHGLRYRETYRNPERDGPGQKRIMFSFSVRSPERTLTSEEADRVRDGIVAACAGKHRAKLL